MLMKLFLRQVGSKKIDVEKYDIDTFVMGDDWQGQFDFLEDQCEVIYLPRTNGISTSKIESDLNIIE